MKWISIAIVYASLGILISLFPSAPTWAIILIPAGLIAYFVSMTSYLNSPYRDHQGEYRCACGGRGTTKKEMWMLFSRATAICIIIDGLTVLSAVNNIQSISDDAFVFFVFLVPPTLFPTALCLFNSLQHGQPLLWVSHPQEETITIV